MICKLPAVCRSPLPPPPARLDWLVVPFQTCLSTPGIWGSLSTVHATDRLGQRTRLSSKTILLAALLHTPLSSLISFCLMFSRYQPPPDPARACSSICLACLWISNSSRDPLSHMAVLRSPRVICHAEVLDRKACTTCNNNHTSYTPRVPCVGFSLCQASMHVVKARSARSAADPVPGRGRTEAPGG
jgi:hypothetical protein